MAPSTTVDRQTTVTIRTSVQRNPGMVYAVWKATNAEGRVLRHKKIPAPNGVGELLAFCSALNWARRKRISPDVFVGATLYDMLAGRIPIAPMYDLTFCIAQQQRVRTQAAVYRAEPSPVMAMEVAA